MYEFLLESLIESLEEGMSASEIDAFKSRAMDYIRMEKEYDSHVQDSLDEDAGSIILRKLESSACQMSRITVERIRAMWNTVIKLEGSDDDVNKKRLQILSQFADMKAVAFRAPDISRAQKTMNASHSGMDKLKSFLLDEIASSAANGRSPHPLLLVGSPGCGKTSLALSLASAFPERGSALISMSGKSAAFELCGSDQSWRASDCGLIIKAFLQAGSLSPVIVFDELDKAGTSDTHSRADSVFLELLERESARLFTDNFLSLPVDVSNGWFIFTANTLAGIPEPLLDRLAVFFTEPYSYEELLGIAASIVSRLNRSAKCPVRFPDPVMRKLVLGSYGTSSSVRSLQQNIERVFALKAREALNAKKKKVLEVNNEEINKILNRNEYPDLVKDFIYSPGIVSGIGIAGDRGFMQPVEARNIRSSFREIKVTGMVEKVMSESADIAYELADAYASQHLGRNLEAVTVNYTYSFHKGGDSASLATALAIISDLLSISADKSTAVTGALSLKGMVLPVGCILAKIEGAANQGAVKIILPEGNRKEVESVPSQLLPSAELVYVSTFDEAVEALLHISELEVRKGA